jgi:complex iron-sulfur molybdoenzyme family reductase subunit gamma
MLAKKVPDATGLLDPAAKAWAKIDREVIDLVGMPVHLQTSRYVRTVWADKLVGKVRAVSVRAAHDGERLAVRMEWNDDTKNTEFAERLFPDAAAVLFPSKGDAPLATMGSQDAKVNAWYWRADLEQGENLVAHGLGTDAATDDAAIDSRAVWDDGRWNVVLSRPLKTKGADNVKLTPGKKVNAAFTIWEGSNRERGDLRSYSRQWRELELEP